MQNNQSSYSRWSWIVALILALILLWMLITGRGPSSACCATPAEVAAPLATIAPAPVAETFHFSASSSDLSSSGDSANVAWLAQSDVLKGLLSGDLKAEGDDKSVVLTGIVDTDATKQQKGTDAQAFFGPNVTVDNQIVVKAAEQPAAVMPPPAAKLYFDTGKTALKNDTNTNLAPIVEWLKANANAKAVISGYHDPRGNQAINEELAKNRAKAVRDALKASGIDEARIEMRKPQSVNGGDDLTEARRVEVSVE
jgi:outer membrane protein OmpA-like peptidoglycan-associated protein